MTVEFAEKEARRIALVERISMVVVNDPEDGFGYCPADSKHLLFPLAETLLEVPAQ